MGSATKAVLGLAVLLALAIGVIGLSTMSGDYRPAPVSETQRAEARAYLASALAPLPRDMASCLGRLGMECKSVEEIDSIVRAAPFQEGESKS